jgi:hypothetical protein
MLVSFRCTAGFPASTIYARPLAYREGGSAPVLSDGRKVVEEGRSVHGGRSDATERFHIGAPVFARSGQSKRRKRPTGLGQSAFALAGADARIRTEDLRFTKPIIGRTRKNQQDVTA